MRAWRHVQKLHVNLACVRAWPNPGIKAVQDTGYSISKMFVAFLLLALVHSAPGPRFSFSNDDYDIGFDDIEFEPFPVQKSQGPSKPVKKRGWFNWLSPPPVPATPPLREVISTKLVPTVSDVSDVPIEAVVSFVPTEAAAPPSASAVPTEAVESVDRNGKIGSDEPSIPSQKAPIVPTEPTLPTTIEVKSESTALPITPLFDTIDSTIETPISATDFLNSLPPSFPSTARSDFHPNTTFCWKRTSTRPFSLLKPCPVGSDIPKGFGICYPPCPKNMFGFGPSCWSKCPVSLGYSCGGSCTRTKSECMSSLFTQISSVSEVVYNLASVIFPGNGMTVKPLKRFTNTVTENLVRSALTRLLAPKLGQNTGDVVKELVHSTFRGKKVDWGGIDPAEIKIVYDAFYRPLCPAD